MRARTVVLAGALVLTPLGAKATDLVVWWQKGFYSQEDAAVQEIVAAFEQGSRKQVELVIALLRERLRVLELITLVDALYDRRVNLVASPAGEPEALYPLGEGAFEFQRTVSRLKEMQTRDYVESPPLTGAAAHAFTPFALTTDVI
jgi:predicted ATPase